MEFLGPSGIPNQPEMKLEPPFKLMKISKPLIAHDQNMSKKCSESGLPFSPAGKNPGKIYTMKSLAITIYQMRDTNLYSGRY